MSADLVVVGSGAAGLSAALRAADLGARVVVLTAGSPLAGSTPRAQGGVAAALGADDSPALHAADTLAVGGGLNDRAAVAVLTAEGESSLHRLITRGVPFDRDLGLEAGHARRRIVHAGGAATGHVLSSALLEQATTHPGITLFAQTRADALLKRNGRVVGIRSGRRAFHAPATVLATGGYAALWGRTTNAPENRGTGLVLAYLAGASLADLEFVQFHPTALSLPGQPAFLLSEALRGEGALLVDARGREVVDPLLPRDVVARALHRHLRATGPVFLSLRHLDATHVHQRFPSLAQRLDEFGLDLARDLLPVAPAAHYCMGGIRTDTWGCTDVPGLFAAGEVACTGAQGANRLASNSLLECLVFGRRAAEAALLPSAERILFPAADTAAAATAAERSNALSDDPALLAEHRSSHGHSAAPPRGLNALATLPTWRTRDLPQFTPLPAASSDRLTVMDPAALGALLDADLGVERSADRLAQLAATLASLATAEDINSDNGVPLHAGGNGNVRANGHDHIDGRYRSNGYDRSYSRSGSNGHARATGIDRGNRDDRSNAYSLANANGHLDAYGHSDTHGHSSARSQRDAHGDGDIHGHIGFCCDRDACGNGDIHGQSDARDTADCAYCDSDQPSSNTPFPHSDAVHGRSDANYARSDADCPHSNSDYARDDHAYSYRADAAASHANLADLSPDVLLAALIARAAFLRQESRGAHFRTDCPDTSPAWRGRIHFRAGSDPRFEEVQPR